MSPTLALYLAVFGALLLVAVLLDDMADRLRAPGILLVLVLGLLTNPKIKGFGAAPGLTLLSLEQANEIAQVALVLTNSIDCERALLEEAHTGFAKMAELMLVRAGFSRAEKLLITVSGLRGAVPIAVAIQAAASTVPWGKEMPPLALGVVLLGLLIQGFSLVPLARRLGLASGG